MTRYNGYDYSRRDSLYEKILGNGRFEYITDIVSIEGAHYHVWVPRDLTEFEQRKFKDDFESAARNLGDPVSFTWDFIPLEET